MPYGEPYEKEGLKMGIASAITSAKNSMIVDNYGNRYADEFIITDSSRPFRYQFYKEALMYELLTMSYPRVPSWLIFDETRRAESCAVATGYSVAAYGLVPWSKDNLTPLSGAGSQGRYPGGTGREDQGRPGEPGYDYR